MPLSPNLIFEKNLIGGTAPWVMLLEITLPGTPATIIRLAQNTEDVLFPCKEGIDTYTKLCSHFDGEDAATAYADPVQGALTFVSPAQLDTTRKKFGTASLLLDGSAAYVSHPDSADWNFGAEDFTIDFRGCFNDTTGYQTFVSQVSTASSKTWAFFKDELNRLCFKVVSGTTYLVNIATTSPIVFAPNTWYHIALVRHGALCLMLIDGVSQPLTTGISFAAFTGLDVSAPLAIGALAVTVPTTILQCFNGWIDEFRISKGIARWTKDFTPAKVAYTSEIGDTYTAFPFQLEPIISESKGQISSVLLHVCNITRYLQPYLEILEGGMGTKVKITVINTGCAEEDVDIAAYEELSMEFDVIDCSSDSMWVTFTLGVPNPLIQRFPLDRYLAEHCNSLYRDPVCGYTPRVINSITLSGTDPVLVETTAPHALTTGAIMTFEEVGGTVELENNAYAITVVSDTTFTLDSTSSAAFTAYTSGGVVAHAFCSRNLSDCYLRNNQTRFNGFPGLRSGGVRFA